MSIRVSICIPTYNRAKMLHEAILSIENNLVDSIKQSLEVIICDNASTDNTKEIAEEFKERFHLFGYYRQSNNVGPVKNLDKVIELATGEYTWILSDDDVLAPQALVYLFNFLSNHADIDYLFYSRKMVDFYLNPIDLETQPKNVSNDLLFSNGNDLFCSCNGQMPFILGFYSSTIIRRELWIKKSKTPNQKINDSWNHLIIILSAIKDRKCAILSKAGVYARFNIRPMKANSRIGFDDSIDCMLEIADLGYSKRQCFKTIKRIVQFESRGFVVDKAKGLRNDNIFKFLSEKSLGGLILYSFHWSVLSLLPCNFLNVLWRMYTRTIELGKK